MSVQNSINMSTTVSVVCFLFVKGEEKKISGSGVAGYGMNQ